MKHVPVLTAGEDKQAQEKERSVAARRELSTQLRQMQADRARQDAAPAEENQR